MASHINPDDTINVAAVCGIEVRLYGDVQENGRRPLHSIRYFRTYGAARLFAQEFEQNQRAKRWRPPGLPME